MIDIKYRNAFSEVLEVLFNLSEDEYNKIPISFIKLIEENSNPEFEFFYNPDKTLDEQNVSIEAKTIIALICRDFLVDKEEKERIIEREKKELLEKYNYSDIFENKKVENKSEVSNMEIIEYKKPLFKHILEKILNLLKLK